MNRGEILISPVVMVENEPSLFVKQTLKHQAREKTLLNQHMFSTSMILEGWITFFVGELTIKTQLNVTLLDPTTRTIHVTRPSSLRLKIGTSIDWMSSFEVRRLFEK